MARDRYVGLILILTAALPCAAGCSHGGDDSENGDADAPDSSTKDATTEASIDASGPTDATLGGDADGDSGDTLDATTGDVDAGDADASGEAATDAGPDAADGGQGLHWRAYLPLTAASTGSNGNGAGITADVSGNGYGATFAHGAAFNAGALVMAGGGDVEIPPESSIPAIDLGGSYSVSAWVSLDDTSGWRTVVSADGTQVSNFYLQKRSDTGFFAFATTPSDTNAAAGGPCIASTAIAPQANTRYHLVATRNAASGVDTIYVNGGQAGTQTCPAATGFGWAATTFGVGHGMYAGANTDYLSGTISSVGLIDRVLTPAEVLAIYQDGPGATVGSGGAHGPIDAGASEGGAPPAQGPCDIYQSGGTPCVAAHSMTRALYSAYAGKLYQVRRFSDGQTTDIGALTAGGFANSAAQDSFCVDTVCSVSILYDQSGNGNHVTSAPLGGAVNTPDSEAIATAQKVMVNGHPVYGVFVTPGVGYRRNGTTGIAKGDGAEGVYMVSSGTHYNGGCCFDYGNAETSSTDTGSGHMEAIYLGNNTFWGTGSGNGPWLMADLENGLFSGGVTGMNAGNTSVGFTFLTAMLKGGANQWAIKAGNAQSGALAQMYSGARPGGYNPMSKEGAIVLGIGGDNSNAASGSFFEGAMTSGYPSDATEMAVQTNITAVRYGTLP